MSVHQDLENRSWKKAHIGAQKDSEFRRKRISEFSLHALCNPCLLETIDKVVLLSPLPRLSQRPSRLSELELLHLECSLVKTMPVSGSLLLRTTFRI